MINRICIIGGGNLGMALAVEIGKNTKSEIILLTSKYKIFNKTITSINTDNNLSNSTKLFLITDNYAKALKNVDIIFVTIPAFLIKNVVNNLILTKKTIIILVPGSGGREFHFKKLADQGHQIIGLDRVPFIARISEPGKTVLSSKKPQFRFSTINNLDNQYIEKLLSLFLDIKAIPISNYLNITFTPSNQILHTSRIYAMLQKKLITDSFDHLIKFYAEWDDLSSEILLSADFELQNICKIYKLSEVIPIKIHYESENAQELTKKIISIKSLSNINSPFIHKNNKYFVDPESRYFQEDFPFGLFIIKDFALIADVNTPIIDKIINWYTSFFNFENFLNLNTKNEYFQHLSLPRNFDLKLVNDVLNYYNIK